MEDGEVFGPTYQRRPRGAGVRLRESLIGVFVILRIRLAGNIQEGGAATDFLSYRRVAGPESVRGRHLKATYH
ncbi:hypothetical protein CH63R_02249 [Colletotrichum higginsianum IMI 349063]|uniref:Uncharacterized protein n=1 Tax=Colletotrichum higginsianum (strain IMI 349063) TaxID=759273 RepID=A0A1B7YNC1_COLHI|nr:hypothetical protein CH63R_02249 [Colletotrichum higginsianum IMI 349063]OBR13523.1 hypothetical protein CH63R_02249 [Colletotrichum higginsianum IMI 349063]